MPYVSDSSNTLISARNFRYFLTETLETSAISAISSVEKVCLPEWFTLSIIA